MAVLVSLAPEADFHYLTAESRALTNAWGGLSSWEPRLLAVAGADGLGLDPAAIPPKLEAASEAFRAAAATSRPRNRFLELVVAAPKSVSLLAALGTDAERSRVVACHRAAVAEVHCLIGRELLWSREAAAAGREYRRAPMSEAAEFVHFMSRRLDPHLHSHLLVPNAAISADGKSRAIDSSTLKFASPHLDLLYLAALERNLADRGLEWPELSREGAARARCLADSGAFSRRAKEIESEMRASGARSRIAQLRTRPAKPAVLVVEAIARDWSAKAASSSGDPEAHPGRSFLGKEMALAEARIVAAARSRGAGILDAELQGIGAVNLDGRRPLNYEGVVLDDALRGRESGTGFGSPPPRQRSYRREDLEAIEDRLHDVRSGAPEVPGLVFRLASGPDQLFELEAALLGVATAGAKTVASTHDVALDWRAVGKPAAASLTRVAPGDAVPRGAGLMLSQAVDPADVASLLRAGAGPGGVVLADAARLDSATNEPTGRGAGWRSWIAGQVEQGSPNRRAERRVLEASLPLTVGPWLEVYESSAALRAALAVRAAAGEELLVADERLASEGVRVVAGNEAAARTLAGQRPPGSPEAELTDAGSLAQAVSLRHGADLYMMAAPIAPPSRPDDTLLVERVLKLAALRMPGFAVDRLAPTTGQGECGIGPDDLCTGNLAALARLGQDSELWSGGKSASGDRWGALASRLLLSPLCVPGLDASAESLPRVPQRLFALLDLIDADRYGLGSADYSRDLRPWLVGRSRMLLSQEVERRLEAEPVIGSDCGLPAIGLELALGAGLPGRVRRFEGRAI